MAATVITRSNDATARAHDAIDGLPDNQSSHNDCCTQRCKPWYCTAALTQLAPSSWLPGGLPTCRAILGLWMLPETCSIQLYRGSGRGRNARLDMHPMHCSVLSAGRHITQNRPASSNQETAAYLDVHAISLPYPELCLVHTWFGSFAKPGTGCTGTTNQLVSHDDRRPAIDCDGSRVCITFQRLAGTMGSCADECAWCSYCRVLRRQLGAQQPK